MTARDVPEAVEVGGTVGVEPEEREPGRRRHDRERQVHQQPGADRGPAHHDRVVGPSFPEPLHGQQHHEQRGIELRRGAEPERDAGHAVPVQEEREQPAGRERDGDEVPVHGAVDEQGGREGEVEGSGSVRDVEHHRRRHGEPGQQQGVDPVERRVLVACDRRGEAHHVHRDHRVLVAVRARSARTRRGTGAGIPEAARCRAAARRRCSRAGGTGGARSIRPRSTEPSTLPRTPSCPPRRPAPPPGSR